jgi:hypothetical protein
VIRSEESHPTARLIENVLTISAVIYCDLLVIYCDLLVIYCDLLVIYCDLLVIYW